MSKIECLSFAALKVNALQEFLVERGITASNLKKEKLVELCKAVHALNLPLDPDFKNGSTTVDLKQKLVKLPIDDPFVDPNFSDDFTDIPTNFTLYDIFNYLLYKTSDYDKKKLRAYKSCEDYRLFIDGSVECLEFNKCGDGDACIFRAKVKPTQRDKTYLNAKYYQLWFSISKSTGEVMSAYCNCIGGMDGACRHVSAALYELEDYEMKSVTDGENKWMKRPRSHDCPVPIKRLRLIKARYSVLNEEKENLIDQYDPRAVDDRNEIDIADFTEKLKEVHPGVQALDILDDNSSEENIATVPEDEACNKYYPYSIREQMCQFKSDEALTCSNVTEFLNKLGQYTPEIVNDIEENTRGQNENKLWVQMRYGLLTASNFSKICQAVDKGHCPPSLIKLLLSKYNLDINVPSLQWGRKKEVVARELYTRVCRSMHRKAAVDKKGLHLLPAYPFIGCSIDGIFSCQCHKTKIIEIKCPYSLRQEHPKDVSIQKGCSIVGNKSFVTEKSEYYSQMQGQMGIYGIPESELVIYTLKGIHVSQLKFNQQFYSEMTKKLVRFFKDTLFEHIWNDV